MKKLVLVALLGAFSAAASADTYVIDSTHTAARFEYTHFGFSNQLHRFNKTIGKVEFDADNKTGSVDVTIPVASVNTGFDKLDTHLLSGDFFNALAYPNITFKSTNVKFHADKPKYVEGELTIKNVTKPVILHITSFNTGVNPFFNTHVLGANAETKILRSDFGVDAYAPYVSDEVTLTFTIEAIKQ